MCVLCVCVCVCLCCACGCCVGVGVLCVRVWVDCRLPWSACAGVGGAVSGCTLFGKSDRVVLAGLGFGDGLLAIDRTQSGTTVRKLTLQICTFPVLPSNRRRSPRRRRRRRRSPRRSDLINRPDHDGWRLLFSKPLGLRGCDIFGGGCILCVQVRDGGLGLGGVLMSSKV